MTNRRYDHRGLLIWEPPEEWAEKKPLPVDVKEPVKRKLTPTHKTTYEERMHDPLWTPAPEPEPKAKVDTNRRYDHRGLLIWEPPEEWAEKKPLPVDVKEPVKRKLTPTHKTTYEERMHDPLWTPAPEPEPEPKAKVDTNRRYDHRGLLIWEPPEEWAEKKPLPVDVKEPVKRKLTPKEWFWKTILWIFIQALTAPFIIDMFIECCPGVMFMLVAFWAMGSATLIIDKEIRRKFIASLERTPEQKAHDDEFAKQFSKACSTGFLNGIAMGARCGCGRRRKARDWDGTPKV